MLSSITNKEVKYLEILNKASAQRFSKVRMVGRGENEIMLIDDALRQADEKGLDLVLVSEDVTPPVVRIQDFKKLEYEKKKAKKTSKQSVSTLKEIQFKVNISDHDLMTKISKISSFLKRGDKVKISVRLKGRERENPDRAFELINKISESVECKRINLSAPGPMAILEPLKASIKTK